MGADPEFIVIYDSYGRELRITREDWRTKVLPGNLAKRWDDPDALCEIVAQALQEGFVEEVAAAARRLREIDPITARSASVLSVVASKQGRPGEAERVLQEELTRHGDDGVVLTNLAKLQDQAGRSAEAEATLWRALQTDPNHDDALEFWAAIHHERGGETAATAALEKVARLPRSWRAQMWLARAALERGDAASARELYGPALALPEVPADALMQISGDLGNAGQLPLIVELVAPRFRPEHHGIGTGNNLLKVYLDLGRVDEAKALMNALYACQRPDWRETLAYWERQLDERTHQYGPMKEGESQMHMLALLGPLWAYDDGLTALLPAKKDGPRVAVMMPTCHVETNAPTLQRSDVAGRLSRALGLALVEAVHLETNAEARAIVPVMQTGDELAFALVRKPWPDETVNQLAGGPQPLDAVALCHADTTVMPWKVELNLFAANGGEARERISVELSPDDPDDAIARLEVALKRFVIGLPNAAPIDREPWTRTAEPPRTPWLASTEQLLAVLAATGKQPPRMRLYEERAMIDAALAGCAGNPASVPWRMLLALMVSRLARVEPRIVSEYVERLALLQREHPIGGAAGVRVQELLDQAAGKVEAGGGVN